MRFKHLNYLGVGLMLLLLSLGCSKESTIEDALEPVNGKAILKSHKKPTPSTVPKYPWGKAMYGHG